ncbi:MFS transporter [Candidatus Bathyarchaeota archaeon]|nr:MFS transporter [Candidatus Bathyarchaeota archaeon]
MAERRLYLLLIMSFSFFMGNTIIGPIITLYFTLLGASRFEVGLLMAISSVAVVMGRIPFGILSERLERWFIIAFSLFIQLLTLLLYFYAPDVGWLFPVRLLHAVPLMSFNPIAISIASDLSPPYRRGAVMGTYLTSVALAMMAGPLVNGILIGWLGYRGMFLCASLFPSTGLLAYLAASRVLRPWSNMTRTADSPEGGVRNLRDSLSSLSAVVKSRVINSISIARVTFSAADGIFNTVFSIYAANELGVPLSLLGFMFTLRGLMNTLARIPAGRISDRVGRKAPLVASYISSIAAYAVLSEARGINLLLLAMAIEGVAWGTRAVTEWALLGDVIRGGPSGVAVSYLSTMFEVGEGLGAIIAGSLSAVMPTGHVFRVAVALLALGTIPITLMRVKKSP